MTAPCFALPLVSALLIGCSSTEKIELQGNQSVGDDYHCTISPKGVVREASRKYDLMPLPIAGIGGKYIFEFEAIAEGEAEITVYNNFRRRDSIHIITYKAVVDKKSKVTLTEKYPNGTF